MVDSSNQHDISIDDDNKVSVRCLTDADGARWHVYELTFSGYDRPSGVSLIFASESVVRRVRNFPVHWRDLSDDELSSVSWNA
jgi:hypothetical protein